MILSDRSKCMVPHQGINVAFLHILLLIGLCGAVGREEMWNTCLSYFAKSKTGSLEETNIHPDQDVHMCVMDMNMARWILGPEMGARYCHVLYEEMRD